jgi:hypothetical protein
MKKKLLKILEQWPKPYISSGDLRAILDGSNDALHSLLKRMAGEGLLIRLKRDFYLILNKIQKVKPESFEIAALLYGPSYISLESALSFHGWIPEAVPAINSVSPKRTQKFETFLGLFAYYKIPLIVFSLGVSSCSKSLSHQEKISFLIADPWKALADLIYLRKKSWRNILALADDLRIEIDLLQHSDLSLLAKLVEIYPNKRVQKTLTILMKDLQR